MKEKVTESGSTLDTSKVTRCDTTFPRVYYCKEVDKRRECACLKVQKLFADVQIRSKSL